MSLSVLLFLVWMFSLLPLLWPISKISNAFLNLILVGGCLSLNASLNPLVFLRVMFSRAVNPPFYADTNRPSGEGFTPRRIAGCPRQASSIFTTPP